VVPTTKWLPSGEMSTSHVGVEHLGALLLVAGGRPVGDGYRAGGQVEHHDLVALETGDICPVADGDQPGAVRGDVELVDVDGAVAGAGDGEVDVGREGAGDRSTAARALRATPLAVWRCRRCRADRR
jgi:hypothetical protein